VPLRRCRCGLGFEHASAVGDESLVGCGVHGACCGCSLVCGGLGLGVRGWRVGFCGWGGATKCFLDSNFVFWTRTPSSSEPETPSRLSLVTLMSSSLRNPNTSQPQPQTPNPKPKPQTTQVNHAREAAKELVGVGQNRADERSALMAMLKQLEEGLQLHREQQVL
jgi:hypothetical protein